MGDDGAVQRLRSRPSSRARTRARRIGVIASLAWLLSVVVTGVIASRAVAVLDTQSSRTGVLSQDEVNRALAAARLATLTPAAPTPTEPPTTPSPAPTTSPAPAPSEGAGTSGPTPHPTATAHPTPTVTSSARPTQVARTWVVNGGTVAATCTGAAISLLYATPQDGWTVDLGSTGPDHLSVELKGSDRETRVTAVCVAGVPQQTVTDHAPDASGSHDSGD